MVFAKEAKAHFSNPRELAVEICYALAQSEGVATAEVAGPGFINIRLKPEAKQAVVREVLTAQAQFGFQADFALPRSNLSNSPLLAFQSAT
jgi:arginyl-tRNA synthetase